MRISSVPIFLIFFMLSACKTDRQILLDESFRGETMGTYYMIKIPGNTKIKQTQVDSIFTLFNLELSTYIDSSFISRFNDPLSKFKLAEKSAHPWFFYITKKALELYEHSSGDFDPTVNPLVNYWGFGTTKYKRQYEQANIDSIMQFVGMDKIALKDQGNKFLITKSDRRVSLDYSAIAKGYGVDIIAAFLEQQNIQNYLIEVGGETRSKGTKADGSPWKLGLNMPKEDAVFTEIALIIEPGDMAVASSGNYRIYYKLNNKTYAHTINPKSGMAVGSDLLAISVVSDECWRSDAIATACMVKGLSGAQSWIEEMPGVEACFFYNQADSITYNLSSNFEQYISK